MRTDKIGIFRGVPVYRVSVMDYINSNYYKDDGSMYLINEDLIYKNEIIGQYDGEYVHEADVPTVFYHEIEHPAKPRRNIKEKEVPKVKTAETRPAETAPTSSTEAKTADEILGNVYLWEVV